MPFVFEQTKISSLFASAVASKARKNVRVARRVDFRKLRRFMCRDFKAQVSISEANGQVLLRHVSSCHRSQLTRDQTGDAAARILPAPRKTAPCENPARASGSQPTPRRRFAIA